MADFKKKKNIFHLIEWILAVVAAILIAGLQYILRDGDYDRDYYVFSNQLISATIYGYLIITSLVFLGLCLSEEIPKKMGCATYGLGAALYLIVGILLICSIPRKDADRLRTIIAVVCCFCNAVLMAIEFFLEIVKKGLD